MDIKQRDKKFIGRDSPALDLDIVKSEGNFLYDSKGKNISIF
jgi:4-aminobutyrate aminotransferase-like enzyme